MKFLLGLQAQSPSLLSLTLALLSLFSTAAADDCQPSTCTHDNVNYYTCTQLAERYDITVEMFFTLNPDLDPDCGNILPNTDYCVEGFIEPVRATDGLCGPPNKNATCLGTAFQCCNAETFTCGNTT
ncbi:hypothetical protein F4819DRAFT_501693 [Hypoxylon fuscum]|nr:hypothetical protein F4819DRAFT_501693 [Hypoxylon fuscum]